MDLARNAVNGALAGAAGSAALDVVTYADMTARARPPSDLPTNMAALIAVSLGAKEFEKPADQRSPEQQHRLEGLGALIGYADGIGMGMLFGIVRPLMRRVPWYVAGTVLAAATGFASEGTATALKQTNPAQWGVAGWIADVVPRCVYGWTTCLTFDRLLE